MHSGACARESCKIMKNFVIIALPFRNIPNFVAEITKKIVGMNKLTQYASLVKFAHTIFAMPFALIGFTLAATTQSEQMCRPEWWWLPLLIQVVLCMVFARNVAMGFNRWADWRIDAANPRTADRDIPAGRISPREALIFVGVNAILFVLTAWTINSLTAILSPVALGIVMFYSYCKRFTSAAHLVLGLSLGIAPVAAYISVTGDFALAPCVLSLVVIGWCAGFDIIYALQDAAFDRERGLHSIPSKFSTQKALAISIALHLMSGAALIWFVVLCKGGWLMWVGAAIFCIILSAEHIIVTPSKQRNIGIAFGTLNSLASLFLAIFIIADIILNYYFN